MNNKRRKGGKGRNIGRWDDRIGEDTNVDQYERVLLARLPLRLVPQPQRPSLRIQLKDEWI